MSQIFNDYWGKRDKSSAFQADDAGSLPVTRSKPLSRKVLIRQRLALTFARH